MTPTIQHTELDYTLAALADPTRRAILQRLSQGEARVTEVAKPFDMSLNAVSKHILVLERAHLVRRRRAGRDHFLSFNPQPLNDAAAWIEDKRTFWSARLDALERALAQSGHPSNKEQIMDEYGVLIDETTVRFERLLPGPIERVWAYLTESDKRGEWFAAGELEPRVGGELELTFRHSTLTPHDEIAPEEYRKYEGCSFTCRVTRYEPPYVLAYTFGDGESGEVIFELSQAGDQVRLVLTQTRIKDAAAARNYASGWHAHLAVLTAKLEGGVPDPFWATHARAEAEYAKRLG